MSSENPNISVQDAPKPGTKEALKADNEALKADNDALRAELEELKASQAASAVAEPVKAPVDERVDIFVPKGYANDEPNMLISVNGVNYLLPKGKTSSVPKHIADEFYRSQKAQQTLDNRVDEMLAAAASK